MLCYEYNLFIIQRTQIRAKEKLPAGKVEDRGGDDLRRAEAGRPAEGDAEGERQGRRPGPVPVSAPLLFTANDCLDIGRELGSPVSLDYCEKAPFKFNGTIDGVNVQYVSANAGSRALQ